MDKDTLSEVISVEREIQSCLELEKTRAGEWLDKIRNECAREALKEESQITDALADAVEKAKKEAEENAAEFVKKAARNVDRLEQLDDGTLQRCVEKHILRILPE